MGHEVGLFRPISLFPFPVPELRKAAARAKNILVVELNMGQMLEDVDAFLQGKVPIHFYGRQGGMMAAPEEVIEAAKKILEGRSN